MGWETIIPTSTINIRSTMILTEKTRIPRYSWTKTHAQTRTEAPLPLTTPEWRSERKGSTGSPASFSGTAVLSGSFSYRGEENEALSVLSFRDTGNEDEDVNHYGHKPLPLLIAWALLL
jgi:hypothetical protein